MSGVKGAGIRAWVHEWYPFRRTQYHDLYCILCSDFPSTLPPLLGRVIYFADANLPDFP